jgi:4-amino-4-deoxy-L-arabinose transferase-like glycosyltransferase
MPEQTHSEAAPEPEVTARQIAVDGVYRDGTIHLSAPLDLQPGAPVSLLVTPGVATTAPPALRRRLALPALPTLPDIDMRLARTDVALLLLGLLVYAASRLLYLDRFPIYFFSDEAIQVTQAEYLLRHGLRDHSGTWLPPYFLNQSTWNLGLSVYLHAVSVALFGKSVFVARATSVAVGMLGVLALALTLKQIFRLRLWWTGLLVLAALPTWFLHSRTAFETVMMVSFYACFVYCYLLYRYRSSRYLVPALLFGAATFYSYTNGQGVMLVSGILLLCSDLRYHLRQPRRTLLLGLVVACVLAVPYLRFHILQPDAVSRQLNEALNSYWFQPRSLGDKLATFGVTYLNGLSPRYWFWPA